MGHGELVRLGVSVPLLTQSSVLPDWVEETRPRPLVRCLDRCGAAIDHVFDTLRIPLPSRKNLSMCRMWSPSGCDNS